MATQKCTHFKRNCLFSAVLMFLATSAAAQCSVTGNQTSYTNCINPITGTLSIKDANIRVESGFYGVSGVSTLGSPFTVNVQDSTFYTRNPTYLISGNLHAQAVNDVYMNLSGTNKFEAVGTGFDSAIRVLSTSKDAQLSIKGRTEIDNLNSDNPGIQIEAAGSARVYHEGQGYIRSTGGGSAIFAKAGADTYVGITSSGVALTTSGDWAHGIQTNAGQASTVINHASITTQNANSSGIYATAGTGVNHITNHGAININGAGGYGLRAVSGTGATSIQSNAEINATQGIGISAQGTGNTGEWVSVTANARINAGIGIQAVSQSHHVGVTSKNTINTSGTGISTQTVAGNTLILQNSGSITATGDGAAGISAQSTGTNASLLEIRAADTVSATGTGIAARSNAGVVKVETTGQVTGTTGVHAQAGGDIWISQTSGRITGSASHGMMLQSTSAHSASSLNVKTDGEINAVNGSAIFAKSNAGTIHIQNTGLLNAKTGVSAGSLSGAVNVLNSGTIKSVGGAGINITSASTAAVENTSTGTITGALTGIDLRSAQSATVYNHGNINAPTAILGDTGEMTVYQISGTVNGDIIFGSGDNTFEAHGGEVNGKVSMGEGNAQALISGTFDPTNLALLDGGASGVNTLVLDIADFSGATVIESASDGENNGMGKGVELSNWDHISLAGGTTFIQTGHLFDASRASSLEIQTGATWKIADDLDHVRIIGDVHNAGEMQVTNVVDVEDVEMRHASSFTGRSLTIDGNYHGNDGVIRLNTALNSDDSVTDKVVITGNATGSTRLYVTNHGGLGDYTYGDGIRVVRVGGSSDTGAFTLAAPVTAGIYEYVLAPVNSDWHLQNTYNAPPVTPTVPGVEGGKLLNPNTGAYLGSGLIN